MESSKNEDKTKQKDSAKATSAPSALLQNDRREPTALKSQVTPPTAQAGQKVPSKNAEAKQKKRKLKR